MLALAGLGLVALHRSQLRDCALAIGQMVTTFDPNSELLSANGGAATLTSRDWKTGQLRIFRLDVGTGAGIGGTAPFWGPLYPGPKASDTALAVRPTVAMSEPLNSPRTIPRQTSSGFTTASGGNRDGVVI